MACGCGEGPPEGFELSGLALMLELASCIPLSTRTGRMLSSSDGPKEALLFGALAPAWLESVAMGKTLAQVASKSATWSGYDGRIAASYEVERRCQLGLRYGFGLNSRRGMSVACPGVQEKDGVSCTTTCRPARSRLVHHRIVESVQLPVPLPSNWGTQLHICAHFFADSKPHTEFFPATICYILTSYI
jgi:hypothetical protein